MKRFWLIIPLALCMFAGCTGTVSEQPQTNSFFAMDTVMDLTIYGNKSLLADVETLISDLEEKVSVTDETSELYTINQTGTGTLTGSAAELMQSALAMCQRTGGYFNLSGRAGLGVHHGELSGARGGNPGGAVGPCGLHTDPI